MVAESGHKEASSWTKFRLLMWKNFLQQWRHRIQTIVELLLPVVTMMLVLIIRWQLEPSTVDTLTYPPLPAYTLQYSRDILLRMNYTALSVAYSPENKEIEDVIRTGIAKMLGANLVELIPIIINGTEIDIPPLPIPPEGVNTTEILDQLKGLIKVTPYSNSSQLRGMYYEEERIREVLTVFQFDDELYGDVPIPKNISYALRFPEKPRLNSFFSRGGRTWFTGLLFPTFETPGPRHPWSWEGGNHPGYVNEMFIALQHAVSMELISRITGEDLRNFTVNIQRFPHPPYVSDMAVDLLQMLFPILLTLSYSYTAVNIVRAVTVEKELQLKETMKIMGLPTWLHWTAWFFKQFIYLFVSSVLVVVLLKVNWFTNEVGFSDYAVFTHTPWSVLLFFILLYLACTIFFCFMISGFFSSASTAALFAGVIWFLTGMPATLLQIDGDASVAMQAFTCLSINSAMTYGIQLMLAQESTGGLQWGEFMNSPATDSTRFLFGHVVIMLVLDSVLYMLVALYLEQVFPGPYGTPKPWYFLFTKDFWCPSKLNLDGQVLSDNEPTTEDFIKEEDPTGHKVGVTIKNLTKMYGNNAAVKDLSLTIYDDQITVMLGHNGAGKSTTISMLTGNIKATHGSVTVCGYDIFRQARIARSHLGLCPQHNVLFSELTVREHLEFFARLKGYKGQKLEDDISSLIKKLELEEKAEAQSCSLSGGQKRRLCVGVALSGGARLVLLDEPTSGMDPAARRALWDLLQREKKGRSMILTTHFMDEADVLGDRVAILAHGRLQALGSPHFLKRRHGVGYTLVLVKDDGFNYDKCMELMHRYIPGIVIKEDRGSEVTFSLLNDHSHLFEEMLEAFETNIEEIKYKNYGLVATSLEDIFMSLGSDLAPINSESEDGTATLASTNGTDSIEQLDKIGDTSEPDVTGFHLICQHVYAMWVKLFLVWTRSWGLVILQLAVPIVLINVTLGVSQYLLSYVDVIQERKLTLAEGFAFTETLLNFNGTDDSSFGAIAKMSYENMFLNSNFTNMEISVLEDPALDTYYLNRSLDPTELSRMRHRVVAGATFSDHSAVAWFSNFGYHDVALSLATLHAGVLKAFDPEAHLNVSNYPLEANYNDQQDLQMMVSLMSMQLSNGIGISVGIFSAVFIMFYIKERASGAKLLQKAAGLQPGVLWGAAAAFDWAWFLVISLCVVVSCAAFQVMGLSAPDELGRMFLALMVYGAAMLPMNYLLSLVFKGPAIGFVAVFFSNLVFGMMGAQIVEALLAPQFDAEEAAHIMDFILQFFPMYSLISVIRDLNKVEMTIQSCLQMCELLMVVDSSVTDCTLQTICDQMVSMNATDTCCIPENSHFQWESPGVLRYIVMMVFSCVAFWALLMAIEYRLFQKLFKFNKSPPPKDTSTMDEDVLDEETHVKRIDKASLPKHGLVAKGLTKYYGKHLAVDQISFSVNDTECFGLLGVNGAGKTTTFKMLMGEERVSRGDAFVSGHSVRTRLTRVHRDIGYCPQFDALFNELTGRETLCVFSLLRGLRREAAHSHAEALAHSLGFLKHLDKRVGQYSGGTKRKLNTAIAFLGKTRLVFVDEPTTGVDPASKRHVWRCVRGAARAGRGVLLTSHSMEESEALCDRLTVMVNGGFRCLGTPQHLKNKFSQGYTLTIKLKSEDTLQTSLAEATNKVKEYVNSNFVDPKLMEQYAGSLTYYVPRGAAWSRMFGAMERARRLSVQYYTISQTTLEQIFLQFTKYQR